MTPKTRLDGLAIMLMIALCMLFGLNQIVVKFALEGISPMMQAGLRSMGATLLLLVWMRWRGERILYNDGAIGWGVLIGALFTADFFFMYLALVHTSASHVTLFLYTSPFWVVLGAHLLLPNERMRLLQMIGMMIAFVGIIIAFGGSGSGDTTLKGDLLALAGAICWALTTLVIKIAPQRSQSAARVLLYQLAVSAILFPLLSVLMSEPGIFEPTTAVFSALLFQIVMIALVGYMGWFWLLTQYPAGTLSSFTFLTPLFGVLAAWLVLDEPLTLQLIGALMLVGAGIYLVNKPKSKGR